MNPFTDSVFRMVFTLKTIEKRSWRNGYITDLARLSLSDDLQAWHDVVDLNPKGFGLLLSETYEHLNQIDQAIQTMEKLILDHPKDVNLKDKLKGLKYAQSLQALQRSDTTEESTSPSKD